MINDEKTALRFGQAIGAVCLTFGREIKDLLLHGYRLGLEDLSIEQIEHACKRAMSECDKMPVPAELRKLAGVPSAADAAMLAWQVVEDSTSIGAYRSVDFSDPVINATIRSLGGWPAILDRSAEEFDKWVRRDFLATYAALARTGVSEEAGRPLAGLSGSGPVRGIDGRMSDWTPEPPVRIDVAREAGRLSQQKPQPKLEDSRR